MKTWSFIAETPPASPPRHTRCKIKNINSADDRKKQLDFFSILEIPLVIVGRRTHGPLRVSSVSFILHKRLVYRPVIIRPAALCMLHHPFT